MIFGFRVQVIIQDDLSVDEVLASFDSSVPNNIFAGPAEIGNFLKLHIFK